MTRYKRRKISGIVKCLAAVVLPIAAAVSVSGASRLKSVLSNTQIMQTRGTPPTSSTVCKDEFDEIFGDCASDTSDIPTAFLSQGYSGNCRHFCASQTPSTNGHGIFQPRRKAISH